MTLARLRRDKGRRGGTNSVAAGWAESTQAEVQWGRSRGAALRWGIAGALLGLVAGVIAFAPAAWLASALASATDGRLLLADARGTVWSGSATLVLTGGPDSRDARSLPGRLSWAAGLDGAAFRVRLRHACCLNGSVGLRVRPGFGRLSVALVPPPDGRVGQWPVAWLGGLGTPFNTLQLGGAMRVVARDLRFETVQGRWIMQGGADLELLGVSSRISTLPTLGSYRLSLAGDSANPGTATLTLATPDGALQLSGSGSWSAAGVRFRGEGRAAPGNEAALSNLLNIIGRRDGARTVISIG